MDKMCRLCMDKGTMMKNIFTDISMAFLEKLLDVVQIKAQVDDGFPAQICHRCSLQLNSAYSFKQRCWESYKKLSSLIALNRFLNREKEVERPEVELESDPSKHQANTLDRSVGGSLDIESAATELNSEQFHVLFVCKSGAKKTLSSSKTGIFKKKTNKPLPPSATVISLKKKIRDRRLRKATLSALLADDRVGRRSASSVNPVWKRGSDPGGSSSNKELRLDPTTGLESSRGVHDALPSALLTSIAVDWSGSSTESADQSVQFYKDTDNEEQLPSGVSAVPLCISIPNPGVDDSTVAPSLPPGASFVPEFVSSADNPPQTANVSDRLVVEANQSELHSPSDFRIRLLNVCGNYSGTDDTAGGHALNPGAPCVSADPIGASQSINVSSAMLLRDDSRTDSLSSPDKDVSPEASASGFSGFNEDDNDANARGHFPAVPVPSTGNSVQPQSDPPGTSFSVSGPSVFNQERNRAEGQFPTLPVSSTGNSLQPQSNPLGTSFSVSGPSAFNQERNRARGQFPTLPVPSTGNSVQPQSDLPRTSFSVSGLSVFNQERNRAQGQFPTLPVPSTGNSVQPQGDPPGTSFSVSGPSVFNQERNRARGQFSTLPVPSSGNSVQPQSDPPGTSFSLIDIKEEPTGLYPGEPTTTFSADFSDLCDSTEHTDHNYCVQDDDDSMEETCQPPSFTSSNRWEHVDEGGCSYSGSFSNVMYLPSTSKTPVGAGGNNRSQLPHIKVLPVSEINKSVTQGSYASAAGNVSQVSGCQFKHSTVVSRNLPQGSHVQNKLSNSLGRNSSVVRFKPKIPSRPNWAAKYIRLNPGLVCSKAAQLPCAGFEFAPVGRSIPQASFTHSGMSRNVTTLLGVNVGCENRTQVNGVDDARSTNDVNVSIQHGHVAQAYDTNTMHEYPAETAESRETAPKGVARKRALPVKKRPSFLQARLDATVNAIMRMTQQSSRRRRKLVLPEFIDVENLEKISTLGTAPAGLDSAGPSEERNCPSDDDSDFAGFSGDDTSDTDSKEDGRME